MVFEIVTNKGRLMMLGPHKPQYLGVCNWTLLHTSDGTSSRIFFDISRFGIHKLAFESPEPVSGDLTPILPTPSSTYPEATSLEDYLYTSAAMEDVIEVTPCEVKVAGRQAIIGLLFSYADGKQACVGQFRLDYAATPLVVVNSSSKMWLSFDTIDGHPFVDGIGVSGPPKPMSRRCLHVSWVGRLEWWLSYSQCKVYYRGQASIATKRIRATTPHSLRTPVDPISIDADRPVRRRAASLPDITYHRVPAATALV